MQVPFSHILESVVLGNTVQEYLVALGILIGAAIVLKIFERVVVHKLRQLAERTTITVDDIVIEAIESIGTPFYVILPLYLAIQALIVPAWFGKAVYYILLVVVVYYAVQAMGRFVDFGFRQVQERRAETGTSSSLLRVLARAVKGVIWGLAVILVLQNAGLNVSSLLAGVGIGGIAIAFALQSVLGDVFASFSIYFDKPFEIGDYIVIGQDSGTVEHVGIKSTRIRTLQGQELIVSNRELTDVRVHNYRRMERRRVVFTFGVTYDTPLEKLKRIPEIVREITRSDEMMELERVYFTSLEESSLQFEVVYYVNSNEYEDYLQAQQQVNLALMEYFEDEGIEFAFPTQTIHLAQEDE